MVGGNKAQPTLQATQPQGAAHLGERPKPNPKVGDKKPTGAEAPVSLGERMPQITNALPPPTRCDVCKSSRVRVYYNNTYNRYAYACRRCKAGVYCHKGTRLPLGSMACASTRRMRYKAHKSFDLLWKDGPITRRVAYEWLAAQLNLTEATAHIGLLSNKDLDRLPTMVAKYKRKLDGQATKKERRDNATNRKRRAGIRKRRPNGKWKP